MDNLPYVGVADQITSIQTSGVGQRFSAKIFGAGGTRFSMVSLLRLDDGNLFSGRRNVVGGPILKGIRRIKWNSGDDLGKRCVQSVAVKVKTKSLCNIANVLQRLKLCGRNTECNMNAGLTPSDLWMIAQNFVCLSATPEGQTIGGQNS